MIEKAEIYADAGKKGLPTYGFYSPDTDEAAFFIRLNPTLDNMTYIEMLAILKALDSKTAETAQILTIYNDNAWAVHMINDRKAKGPAWVEILTKILELHDKLTATGKVIKYTWIYGHDNMADHLLRAAIRESQIDVEYPLKTPDVEKVLTAWKNSRPQVG